MKSVVRTLVLALLALNLVACPLFGSDGNSLIDNLKPDVSSDDLQLRHAPSMTELAGYLCPQILDDPIVGLTCEVFFGPPPPKSHMAFEFGLGIGIENPNEVPIPALNLLVAMTLFEEVNAEALGAICVNMCGEDDLDCGPVPLTDCATTEEDITSPDDLINRLPGLIEDIATGKAQDELRKGSIAAGGDVKLDLAFVLGIDQGLTVFEKALDLFISSYDGSQDLRLEVPVSADGAVFVRVPALGRVGVNYGPLASVWVIE